MPRSAPAPLVSCRPTAVDMSVIDMMRDAHLLGPFFEGASWDRWRAALKAAFALPMTKRDRELFHEVAERDPPKRPVRELVCIIGRGGGTDSIASALAAYLATTSDFTGLRPGERGVVLCQRLPPHRLTVRALQTVLWH